MDEEALSWLLASLILGASTLALTLYQTLVAPLLQPTFLFFVFQLPSIISVIILVYHVKRRRKSDHTLP